MWWRRFGGGPHLMCEAAPCPPLRARQGEMVLWASFLRRHAPAPKPLKGVPTAAPR
jgi:hypothetical protein